MFLVNSRQGHFSAASSCSRRASRSSPTKAILLPKLRIHFAEFLNEGYPAPLSILYSSTCVGLRYGHASLTRGFSRQHGLNRFHPIGLTITPQLSGSFNPHLNTYELGTGSSNRRPTYPSCVTPSLKQLGRGTGILTCCPSATPFGLTLGPTNPTRIDLPSETLDLRGLWFSHSFRYSCQHSHFWTLHSSLRYCFAADQNARLLL